MSIKVFCLFFISFYSALCGADSIYFIANKSVAISRLREGEVRDIYLKKMRYWPDGQKIRPVDRSVGSPDRMDFLTTFLQMSDVQCVEYWIQQKQETGAVQPLQVASEQIVLHLIETMPGAIGYLRGEKSRGQIMLYKNIKVLTYEK